MPLLCRFLKEYQAARLQHHLETRHPPPVQFSHLGTGSRAERSDRGTGFHQLLQEWSMLQEDVDIWLGVCKEDCESDVFITVLICLPTSRDLYPTGIYSATE